MDNASPLKNVPVLVTGASGFIGTHLCKELVKQGAIVHAVSRIPKPHQEGIRWWQSSLASKQEVEELLQNSEAEIIYHLAGAVSASQEIEMVQATFESLLQSSLYILEAVTAKGCRRLIFTGSLNEPVGGVDAVPTSPYSAAKWMSSGYARMFHKLYQTPVVLARLFMGYGPGQSDFKVIPSIINSYLQGIPPKLTSGDFKTDWIYITDLVNGLVAAATTPALEGHTVDLASGEKASVRDIAMILKEIMHATIEPQFGALPDRIEGQMRTADISATAKLLGWQAQINLRDGLKQSVGWYKKQNNAYLAL